MKFQVLLARVLIVVIPLVAYEAATRMQLLDPFTFSPLSEMLTALFDNLTNPVFLSTHVLVTMLEIALSFAGAALFGIIVGVLMWRSNYLYYSTQPYLLLFYALPFFAVYPIFVSIFGLGPLPVITVGMLFSVPAVIANTAIGFRETREVLVKVGQSFNLSFRQLLLHVFFPAAWPHIFTGLRLAVAYSIIGVIATEFILSGRGIGYTISFTYNNFDLNNMYASVLLVVLFAVLVIGVLGHIESRLYSRSNDQ